MEEIKDNLKLKVITLEGYKVGIFLGAKKEKDVLEIVEANKLELGLIITKSKAHKYLCHLVTTTEHINPGFVVNRLIERYGFTGVFHKTENLVDNTHKFYVNNLNFLD